MRRALLLALLLVALPAADAARVEFALAPQLDFTATSLLSGHIETNITFNQPRIADPRALQLAGGELTVCETDRQQNIVERLAAGIAQDCESVQTFDAPNVTFAPGARMQLAGAYELGRDGASLIAIGGDGVVAWLSSDPLTLAASQHAFAGQEETTQVIVEAGDETHRFNGTAWVFTYEGNAIAWDAPGIIGAATLTQLRLDQADPLDVTKLPDPFVMLDLQEMQYGAESRQRRSDLAEVVREFGRVPNVVNGAIYGHLDGHAGKLKFSPGAIELARFTEATLAISNTSMAGDGKVRLTITPDGISTGGQEYGPAWSFGLVLWIVAIAVSILRRHDVTPRKPRRMANAAFGVVTWLLVDLYVMNRIAGTSALTAIFDGHGLPVLLGLALIDFVLFLLTWGLYVVPVRRIVRKVTRRGFRSWVVDMSCWLGMTIWVLILPAKLLALAYVLVRF